MSSLPLPPHHPGVHVCKTTDTPDRRQRGGTWQTTLPMILSMVGESFSPGLHHRLHTDRMFGLPNWLMICLLVLRGHRDRVYTDSRRSGDGRSAFMCSEKNYSMTENV